MADTAGSGWRNPASVRSSVLLPAPLRPMTHQHWPASTCPVKIATSVRSPMCQ